MEWRILEPEEELLHGDEVFSGGCWRESLLPSQGIKKQEPGLTYCRQVESTIPKLLSQAKALRAAFERGDVLTVVSSMSVPGCEYHISNFQARRDELVASGYPLVWRWMKTTSKETKRICKYKVWQKPFRGYKKGGWTLVEKVGKQK